MILLELFHSTLQFLMREGGGRTRERIMDGNKKNTTLVHLTVSVKIVADTYKHMSFTYFVDFLEVNVLCDCSLVFHPHRVSLVHLLVEPSLLLRPLFC